MQKNRQLFFAILFYSTFPFKWVWKILFKSFPSVTIPDKRWALFQTLLSFALFFIGLGIALFSIISTGGGGLMVAGWVLFGIGMAGLLYTIGLGIYFYNKHGKKTNNIGDINKKFIDDLKRIKEAENERNKKT